MYTLQEFTSTLKTGYIGSWPPRLTFHTATCLVNPDMVDKCLTPGTPPLTQKLLIAWGKDDEQSISSDVWLLEINGHDCGSIRWKKVKFLFTVFVLMITILRYLSEIIVFFSSVPPSFQHTAYSLAHSTTILY